MSTPASTRAPLPLAVRLRDEAGPPLPQMVAHRREQLAKQRDNAACDPASCINGKCQATGECACPPWPATDREWARLEVDYSQEVTPEQVRAVDALTAPEFATGDCVDVETESPPLAPLSGLPPIDTSLHTPALIASLQKRALGPGLLPPPRTIIAFTGLAGAGKSTAAAHLVKHRGFERVRFAGPLKAMMAAFFSACGLDDRAVERRIEGDLKETPCKLLCGKTPRFAMQRLGTEWGRDILADDLWIRAWQAAVEALPAGVPVVVDDCRFPNEGEAVVAAGGIICRITRPGAGTSSQHVSESHMIPADAILYNTLDQRNLREQVDVLIRTPQRERVAHSPS